MADAKSFRPGRPSVERAAAAEEARRFAGEAEQVPLKLRVHPETRNAIQAAARGRGKSLRRLILSLCKEAGIEIHPDDANEAADFGRGRVRGRSSGES